MQASQPQQSAAPMQPPPNGGAPGSAPYQQQQFPNHPGMVQQRQIQGVNYASAAPAQPQQQNHQQQQHFPHQGLNGGWQSDKDYHDRRKMIAKIVHLLQQRKPNAPQEWIKKLPQMAKRLEESLYRSAKSFDEYNDAGTLKMRLQQLAVNIGMKTKKMQQQQQQAVLQQKAQPRVGVPTSLQPLGAAAPQPLQQQPMQPVAPKVPQPLGQQPPMAPAPVPLHSIPAPVAPMAAQQQIKPQPVQQPVNGQRMVNMSDINPIMAQQQQQEQQPPAPAPALQQSIPSINFSAVAKGVAAQTPAAAAPAGQWNGDSVVNAAATVASSNGLAANRDRQQVLRHQQQRLLLLRHAAKCQHEDGRCPVTPHCAGMKRLWKHIAECKNQKCLVPHCVSSRYVLSHYHRCKDVRCPVCGPVREAIHRSHEKQKQMQALRQRQQQSVVQQPLQPPPTSSAPPSSTIPTMVEPAVSSSAMPVNAPPIAVAPAPLAPAMALQPVNMMSSSAAALPLALERPNKRPKTLVPPSIQPTPLPAAPVQVSVQTPIPQPPPSPHAQVPVQPVTSTSAPAMTAAPTSAAPTPVAQPAVSSSGQVIMPKHVGPKTKEDHTLINCFSLEQIETHIASLNNGLQLSPQRLKTKCLEVLKGLQSHQHAWVFNTPVDPVELNLPDYFEVIKKPMDLGTIRKKLDNGVYHRLEEFEEHVVLTFDNAMLYNPEGTVVYNMAKDMKAKFEIDYKNLLEQLEAEEDVKRRNGEACLLCGCEKLLFEPPVFYCNGINCPSKRIRRNSYYYVGGNNQYHWCHQCFQELRDNASIDLGDITIKKESLAKKKNDEVHEESWVQCDRCNRWVHQICALFNTRQNKDQRSEYACPRCTIEERRRNGSYEATSSTPMAEDLPRTKLSEYLEQHVREKVDHFLDEKAIVKAEVEGIPVEEARKKIEMGGEITIRQVTSMDRKLEVRERMKKRYSFKNYPDEFNFRCKCIVVFQNLDGVDVILFGLYVYEHNEKNPAPNTRTVYISYLDSVHFMRPRQMRTFIYHEILIAYLDYVRRRGFASAHIWACPPLKGDDYILYAKPEDQKTPKDERLRQWYIDMLVECQKRGIVGLMTNMYDLYFANEKNDATVVPYMDGDYFPAEVENIIKDIEEGKSGKKKDPEGKKKKADKQKKKKAGRSGTRSAGLDEEAFKASGVDDPSSAQKSLEEGGRDYVMVKLGETIQPMKESFIVAYLAWEGATEEQMEVPAKIKEYREKHGIDWRLPKSEKTESSSIVLTETEPTTLGAVDVYQDTNGSYTVNNGAQAPAAVQSSLGESGLHDAVVSESQGAETTGSDEKVTQGTNMTIREGKFAAMAARKRDREGTMKEPDKKTENEIEAEEKEKEKEKLAEMKVVWVTDRRGRRVKVLDDDDEELDCEFLNNRQAFLNLCQGNHYQFDNLRRAKHSSMMVLWHLHNRDAPKFVQQCATCSREILQGYRFHCPACADFDQCQECLQNPNIPRHPHPLKPMPVAAGQQNELTEVQRKERQRSIQLHMTLLLHAATCKEPRCPSANCAKMKGLLKHGTQCQIKATGGCNVCKRIWALLQIHARQCKAKTCPVPNCMAIRERVRQLKKQQQAMDDRRRQEMNRAYRGKR